jgi:hypothetical protein
MSKAYQFPEDPQQPNPFADPAAAPREASDNPYAASAVPAGNAAPVVGDYQATLAHRGGVLLGLSLVAVIATLACLPFSYFCLPIGVLLLALCLPVWGMAHGDLRAMQAGAMDPSGKSSTRIAWWLSLVATLLALLSGAISLFWMLWLWNR